MSPYRRPGRALINGHIVRSNMEAALCGYLSGAKEPHNHATLNFDVPIGPRRVALYTPSIVLTETHFDDRMILIEPIDAVTPGGGLRRLTSFRQAHADGYFLIVVARRALHHSIPEPAYDLLVPLDDFAPLDEFLRNLA